ncbi:MAG: endonuclease/exonuclease/phosphatase family protein [Paludibacteraceae bacterium]|nr:endonuclease/exonuclease/phosphatase family protein [Paludibacteraceae bacterium]
MRHFSRILVLLVNLTGAAVLLTVWLAGMLPVGRFTSLFSSWNIAFLFLMALNLLFVFFWIGRRHWGYLFVSLTVLLLNIPNFFRTAAFSFDNDNARHADGYTVLSYNVHYLDMLKHGPSDSLIRFLNNSDADVICLQEFYYEAGGRDRRWIFRQLNQYPYYRTESITEDTHKGLAIYSKFPIVHHEFYNYGSRWQGTMVCDIAFAPGDTLRVLNSYLQSNRLTAGDKAVYQAHDRNELQKIARRILDKLGKAAILRSFQADSLAQIREASPYPTINCGDMNDLPTSYSYRRIRSGDKDAFLQHGRGLGTTFHEFPYRFRLDYFFTDPRITTTGFEIRRVEYSDHYPIFLHFKR